MEPIDPDLLKSGMALVMAFPKGGWPADRQQVALHELNEGDVVAVRRVEVQKLRTLVWLHGHGDEGFNAEHFADPSDWYSRESSET